MLDMTQAEPNDYLEKVRLKRQRNEEKISQLGLSRFVTPDKPLAKKKHRGVPRSSDEKNSAVQNPRRSSRVSNKAVDFMILDYDMKASKYDDTFVEVKEPKVSRKKSPPKRKFDLGQQISPRERSAFDELSSDEWVTDMQYYFSRVQGNSDSNVQRVMCTVRKLVSGEGIRHPQTQNYFRRNKKIHLGLDFRQMLDEATEWVHENGGDRGNGWLIEHPVKKLWLYQQARAENNYMAFSK